MTTQISNPLLNSINQETIIELRVNFLNKTFRVSVAGKGIFRKSLFDFWSVKFRLKREVEALKFAEDRYELKWWPQISFSVQLNHCMLFACYGRYEFAPFHH